MTTSSRAETAWPCVTSSRSRRARWERGDGLVELHDLHDARTPPVPRMPASMSAVVPLDPDAPVTPRAHAHGAPQRLSHQQHHSNGRDDLSHRVSSTGRDGLLEASDANVGPMPGDGVRDGTRPLGRGLAQGCRLRVPASVVARTRVGAGQDRHGGRSPDRHIQLSRTSSDLQDTVVVHRTDEHRHSVTNTCWSCPRRSYQSRCSRTRSTSMAGPP